MAAGLAVVGSDNSGMREALGPQGERFLAAAGDAGGLADRMLMLAEDQQLREQVGATNRRRIETEFNPETTRAQMASLIVDRLTKKSAVPDKTGIDPSFDRSLRANQ